MYYKYKKTLPNGILSIGTFRREFYFRKKNFIFVLYPF